MSDENFETSMPAPGPAAELAHPTLAPMRRRKTPGPRRRTEVATAMTMLIPSFIGVGLFLLVPLLVVFGMSWTNWTLLSMPSLPEMANPVTWFDAFTTANYERLASNTSFRSSIWVTVLFSLMAIPLALLSGLLIAVLLNRKLPGSGVLQLLYVLPWIAAPLALGIVWNWMLAPSGVVNQILGSNWAWTARPTTALPAIAFVYIWQNAGYISLFFLAALQNVPSTIYEAARIDGAGPVRTLWSITLPLIRPTMFFVMVTSFIASLQVYDLVYGLTGGVPGYPQGTTNVITAHIYQSAFIDQRIGYASAMAVVLTVIIVAITAIQQLYFRGRLTYEME